MRIVLLGAPGCGKGTQAKNISLFYNIPSISTGEIFRKAISNDTDLGKQVKKYMSTLVPDEIVVKLIEERLKDEDCAKGYILDGFPRTINQAEVFLKNNKIDRVIYFKIDEETVINRILSRRTCKDCGEIYSLLSYSGTHCKNCNGELVVRSEDEKIKERIDTYKLKTFPLVDYFRNKNLLFEIDTTSLKETEPKEQINEIFGLIKEDLSKIKGRSK